MEQQIDDYEFAPGKKKGSRKGKRGGKKGGKAKIDASLQNKGTPFFMRGHRTLYDNCRISDIAFSQSQIARPNARPPQNCVRQSSKGFT